MSSVRPRQTIVAADSFRRMPPDNSHELDDSYHDAELSEPLPLPSPLADAAYVGTTLPLAHSMGSHAPPLKFPPERHW